MQTAPENITFTLTPMTNPKDFRRKLIKKIKKIKIDAIGISGSS